jgi:hypothetical protein
MIIGLPSILGRNAAVKYLFLLYATSDLLALRILFTDKLREFLLEAKRRNEIRWGLGYGYLIITGIVAVFSTISCAILLERKLSDAIGVNLLATRPLLYYAIHISAILLATLSASRIEKSSRRPIVWLLLGELVVAAIVAVHDFLTVSTIHAHVYPAIVLAICGLWIAQSRGTSEYMKQRSDKR